MNGKEYVNELNLYKRMYYHIFNKVTDALGAQTIEGKDTILKQAQIETEEMYIRVEDNI